MTVLRQKLDENKLVIGGMITHFLRPAMIKIYAKVGFDFIYIENEHAMHNPATLTDCILTARDNNIPIVIKPPYLDRGETARLLDAGVSGIQLPQTETREQIDQFGSWVKYPPQGTRMVTCASGINNFGSMTKSDLEKLNRDTIIIAHIETVRGLDNIESIAESPFVDVVFVGLADFSVSFGKPFQFDDKQLIDATKRIFDVTIKAGKIPGVYAPNVIAAENIFDLGVRFIETADEITFILSGAQNLMKEFQKLKGRK